MTAEAIDVRPRYLDQGIHEHAKSIGVDTELKPASRIVVFAVEGLTPLGTISETFDRALVGDSGIEKHDFINNSRTNIAGLSKFNPADYYARDELKRMEPVTALADHLAQQIVKKTGLAGETGKLKDEDVQKRFGVWIGTGLGPTPKLIDAHETITSQINKDTEEVDLRRGSRFIDPNLGIKLFPQNIAGRPAMTLGAQGWSGSVTAACATGEANVVELAEKIREGHLDAGIAGGLDFFNDPRYIRVVVALFAALRATSARNDDPHKASRPLDIARDGFVPSTGGALTGLASEEFALKHGLPILAEYLGGANSVDGYLPTEMEPKNVGRTMLKSLYDRKTDSYYNPHYFGHFTSTDLDTLEIAAMKYALGDAVNQIPVTDIKGYIGHLLGGAGSVNFALMVEAIQRGEIFPLANLENPDPVTEGMDLVRFPRKGEIYVACGAALGFDGFNSFATIGKYESEEQKPFAIQIPFPQFEQFLESEAA